MEKREKKPIRIAIPTNDGITIFRGMLGRAQKMYIYGIENGAQVRLVEKRTNPYSETMQHLKTLDVYKLLRDCTIIISGTIGKKGVERLQERGLKLFFRKGNIQEALADVVREE